MYNNPDNYFIIIGAVVLGIINILFILNILRAIISSFT